jgi:HAE1 family hydrophobic/amphiphilic exporter-1
MTTLLTTSCILFGILAYHWLPVNDLPVVDYPVIQVQVTYPGASPQTMANNVATPLERQFMQIPGLDVVTSASSQGYSSLTLQFNLNKSIDGAATDVQTAITQASGSLPLDLPSPPTFTKSNPNDQAILYVALTSDSIPASRLYDYASTNVGQRLSILQGVSRVLVYGTKSAIRIKANPSAMAQRGVTIDDISAAITSSTTYQGAGQFDGKTHTLLLQPQSQLLSAVDYDKLIIKGANSGTPVYLRDVASTVDSVADERVSMHFWAREAETPTATVVVAVFRQAGANAIEVSKEARDLLPAVLAELPPSIRLTPIYDRSQSIVNSVTDVQSTLLIAFVLVVAVIFMFLGRARDTLIPTVALPLSLLLTFIAMSGLGYSLDNLSLMALTLAIGFLVDDAIVFLENTVRRMEHGEEALPAALNSAKEISFTILSMTVSLAAVFIPLVFMPGLVGRIFREFSVTIIISIFASGLVSLTLTPLMCARLLARRGHDVKKTWVERVIGGVEARVLAVYSVMLTWFLRYRWVSAVIWILCMIGTVVLFEIIPKSFLPVGDSGFIVGILIAQEGSSPERMHSYQDRADTIIRSNPAVHLEFSATGISNFFQSNQAILLSFLYPPENRVPIAGVAGQLMGQLSVIPGTMSFQQPQPVLSLSTGVTSQNQGQFAYAISGINPDQVYEAAQKLIGKLYTFRPFGPNGPPGFLSVSSDLFNHTPGLEIEPRRDQAASYGVSPTRIINLIRDAYSQNYVYLIKKPDDQYQVILEVDNQDRSIPENLSLLYIHSDDGQRLVPMSSLVEWHPTIGPAVVNHINQFTSVTIFFNLMPGVPLGTATDFVQKTAADPTIVPINIRGSLQGEALTFQQTMASLTILMLLAVFVMYVILGILYESYIHPVTVLSALPIALVGGLATLLIFGSDASLYAFIGLFMLMGIVKKNGIMIVDFALQRIDAGDDAVTAIHQASMDRFRPILMTTMAALMGALPIAFGFGADGASRRPLGLVIVGGLIVSQFITLFITPVIYLYMEMFQEKVLDRTSFFRSSRQKSNAHGHGPQPQGQPVHPGGAHPPAIPALPMSGALPPL